ncbi:MAG: alpha/beta hydrolase [Vulcanimicrobiaceae bacterium]
MEPSFLMRDDDRIAPSSRSIVLLHAGRTDRVALLFHGMSASPRQLIRYAQSLHEAGYNVLVPRLPAHGHVDRMSPALAYLTAERLTACSLRSLAWARSLGQRVLVAGFSLGGVLAAWIAQHEAVDHAVPIAPFFGVAVMSQRRFDIVAQLALWCPNRFLWWDRDLRERLGPAHGYPRFSTHGMARAYRFGRSIFADAALQAPATRRITLVSNLNEIGVDNRAIARLAALWRGHGAWVDEVSIEGLPPSHDIIEPERGSGLAQLAFAQVLRTLDQLPSAGAESAG